MFSTVSVSSLVLFARRQAVEIMTQQLTDGALSVTAT
jgi:hypothetical protein